MIDSQNASQKMVKAHKYALFGFSPIFRIKFYPLLSKTVRVSQSLENKGFFVLTTFLLSVVICTQNTPFFI